MKVFGKTGTTQIYDKGKGEIGFDVGDTLKCDEKVLKVTKPTYEGSQDWEGNISKVKFKLDKCDKKLGREVCNIEIADDFDF